MQYITQAATAMIEIIDKATYKKTDNPNIIKQTETVESEIHIDKLEEHITDLETQIASTPQLIETGNYPDEILALINEHNSIIDNTELQKEIDSKKSLLNEMKKL